MRQLFTPSDFLVPTQLRHVLIIEFEYTRVYLNSLALQAVVERCTHNTPLQTHAQPNGMGNGVGTNSDNGNAIPFSTLTKWYANDRHYMHPVMSSRSLLKVCTLEVTCATRPSEPSSALSALLSYC
jgi:hypothetical protein